MANFLLPGRAGDLARCVLLGRAGSLVESSRTLATLAVEKVLDGLALVAMVLFSVWALHPPHWVLDLLRAAILIFGAALIYSCRFDIGPGQLIDFVRRAFRRCISLCSRKSSMAFSLLLLMGSAQSVRREIC